jgi:hypothetical protein
MSRNEIYYCTVCGKPGKFIGRKEPEEPICYECLLKARPMPSSMLEDDEAPSDLS